MKTQYCVVATACTVFVSALLFACGKQPTHTTERQLPTPIIQATTFGKGYQILVANGDPAGAENYYRTVITGETGFNTEPAPTLSDLLIYFGYSITGEELESQDSSQIMGNFAGEDVIVSRFFAPKITDVSASTNRQYGWRKIVRLNVQPASQAEKRGLKSMYLLFNIFSAELVNSPFKKLTGVNHSVNNQVMLIREPGSALKRPAYFMTFGPYDSADLNERGKLIKYLDATFDISAPGQTTTRYFVPKACEECHGTGKPKLNYLDTDHWFDRVKNSDFDAVGTQPLVFDAGTNDSTKPEYKKAFDVLRKLNAEILKQNKDADDGAPSFQQRAAESWVNNHATADRHLPLLDRSITSVQFPGSAVWSASNPEDQELLPLLNRYCFRCHSSIRFHIYDKNAVIEKRNKMISRIDANPHGSPPYFMPQDRELVDPDRSRLKDLLGKLKP